MKFIYIERMLAIFFFSTQLLAVDNTSKIIEEIIATEKSYNQALKEFKLHFIDFLANDRKDQNLKNIGAQFTPLGSIVLLSDDLLKQLQSAPKSADAVAKIFISLAPYFKVYGPYVADYPNINTLLNKPDFKNNATVVNLIKKLTEERNKRLPGNKINKVDINDYSIQPIQRVPRYGLLLNELVEANPNSAKIKEALAAIKEVGILINNFKRTTIK